VQTRSRLVLLLGVMVLGLIGLALYVSGSNRRAALASRRARRRGRSAYRASVERLDQMLRRTRQGARLSQWLRASGGPLSPVDAVAIVVVGGLLLGLLLLALLPPLFAFIFGYAIVVGGLRWYVERARNKRRDAFMDQLPRPRAHALQRHPGRGSRSRGRCRWRRASSTTRPEPRWRRWSRRCGSASRWTARSSACRSGCRRARWRC
jgi:tight adherence protein B